MVELKVDNHDIVVFERALQYKSTPDKSLNMNLSFEEKDALADMMITREVQIAQNDAVRLAAVREQLALLSKATGMGSPELQEQVHSGQ